MAFEKLTYSRDVCNNYLYYAFYGDFFDTNIITNELGITPTSFHSKKDPVPKFTSWKYTIAIGDNLDLETPLERLIDIFEPKVAPIILLKDKLKLSTRLQFVVYIDVDPNASTPYFGLSNRTIHFLSKTDTHVDFDLYKADTIGLLDRDNLGS